MVGYLSLFLGGGGGSHPMRVLKIGNHIVRCTMTLNFNMYKCEITGLLPRRDEVDILYSCLWKTLCGDLRLK